MILVKAPTTTQRLKADALWADLRDKCPPGASVHHWHEQMMESGALLVSGCADFDRFPSVQTETRVLVKIGPRGGVTVVKR